MEVNYGGNITRSFKFEGTNILESTAAGSPSPGMKLNDGSGRITFLGNGSLTFRGSVNGGAGIEAGGGITIEGSLVLRAEGGKGAPGIQVPDKYLTIKENAFVVATGGEGAKSGIQDEKDDPVAASQFYHDGGLLIYGTQQPGGSIRQEYSELKGDLTLGSNAEIPAWATVTVNDSQTLTVPDGVTLTNNGTLANNGTLTNEGTLTGNGTLTGTGTIDKPNNIGGDKGFDITGSGLGPTWSYDSGNKLLTIGGGGDVSITGKNKANPVECGIVVKNSVVILIIQDLYLQAEVPLEVKYSAMGVDRYFKFEGTNILESTAVGSSGSGMIQADDVLSFGGSGSLTVRGSVDGGAGIKADRAISIGGSLVLRAEGGKGAPGIQISGRGLTIQGNAFVVATGGEGAASGIQDEKGDPANASNFRHLSGLLIYGTQQPDGSILQEYSELKGNPTLGFNAEIPAGATVTVNDSQTLTVPNGVTLTNSGDLTNNGTLTNRGRLCNSGTLSGKAIGGNPPEHQVVCKANYPNGPADQTLWVQRAMPSPPASSLVPSIHSRVGTTPPQAEIR